MRKIISGLKCQNTKILKRWFDIVPLDISTHIYSNVSICLRNPSLWKMRDEMTIDHGDGEYWDQCWGYRAHVWLTNEVPPAAAKMITYLTAHLTSHRLSSWLVHGAGWVVSWCDTERRYGEYFQHLSSLPLYIHSSISTKQRRTLSASV